MPSEDFCTEEQLVLACLIRSSQISEKGNQRWRTSVVFSSLSSNLFKVKYISFWQLFVSCKSKTELSLFEAYVLITGNQIPSLFYELTRLLI